MLRIIPYTTINLINERKIIMLKKITALMLICSMALTLFACGKNENPSGNGDTPDKVTNANSETIEIGDEKIEYSDKIPSALKAVKVGTITDDVYIYTPSSSDNADGFYYQTKDGKYGIMSLDGKSDTGAKYTVCKAEGKYFSVATVEPDSVKDISDLNCLGLVDVNGRVIVPMEYAAVDVISERYVRVSTVDNVTENRDDGLVFIQQNNEFSFVFPNDNDTLLSGKWEIFDMVTGKPIEGISGTKAFSMNVYGNIVKYVNDEKEYVYTNEKGESLEHRSYFDNGCYVVEADDAYTFCDSEGKTIFTGSTNDFVPNGMIDEYIEAQKYTNGTFSYVLMDMNGKIVSGEFEKNIVTAYGGLYTLLNIDGLYKLNGQKLSPDGYGFSSFEDVFGFAWSVKSGDNTAVMDAEGNILVHCNDFDGYNFVDSKKINGETYCYSYKDKDYTIKGQSIAPWLVKGTEDYSSYFIYDTISGEKIIDGYKQFNTAVDKGEGIYVYAKNADSSTDIYLVK